MMNNIGIYKITNKVNNAVYIGQSSEISTRWNHHRNDFDNQKHHNKHLQAAWNKYGADAFSFDVVEYCDPSQLDERETYYIDLYDSFYNGYNLDRGGKGIRGYKHTEEEIDKMRRIQNTPIVLQFDMNFNLTARWNGGVTHISKQLGYTKECIRIRCAHNIHEMSPYKNSYWVYEEEYNSDDFSWEKYFNNESCISIGGIINNKLDVPIVQYDKKRNYVKTWYSLSDILDAGFDINRVKLVCNHTRLKSTGGYIWCYEGYDFSDGYFDKKKDNYKQRRSVAKLDDNYNIIETYDSLTEAAISVSGRQIKPPVPNIIRAIQSGGYSFGCHWKYL